MKVIFGAVAAAMLVGAVWAQPAEARCFWNGFETVCVHHSGPMYGDWGYRHHFYRDFDRPIYRDWY